MKQQAGRTVMAFGLAVLMVSCAQERELTVADARHFLEDAEAQLLHLWIETGRAAWIQNNFITEDTNASATAANSTLMAETADLASESARFNHLDLPTDLKRKLTLLRTSLTAVAPSDSALQDELAELMTNMESRYGRGEHCPASMTECLDLPTMERRFADVRETDELLDMWIGWREVSPPMRPHYVRFVEIANAGARDLGFANAGEMWRSGYDMPADQFSAELERLWDEVRPLYESLHCYVRAQLGERYGTAVVPDDQAIPAHLLGNMWSQSWGNLYDDVRPRNSNRGVDITNLLERHAINERQMVRFGEQFFSSLGFPPLPQTFWDRSLFVKPRDRDVVCHASAWNLDYEDDIRIKMCIGVNDEDFVTIHHELGHNYYQRAYRAQDPLFRSGANDGFHEGVGDAIALSITPEYLAEIGLLRNVPQQNDVGLLLHDALNKVAFLPFGLLVDQWRWKVFSGEIPSESYNAAWWELREKYQGVRPPVPRSEKDFDPGAKYHVPANVPYTRYFLAHILQFQFHRGLCEVAGVEGPLHRCSIFQSVEAGERLLTMLQMGASRPWPDALEVITGSRDMDATAILDYFAPLAAWLDEQNASSSCGW